MTAPGADPGERLAIGLAAREHFAAAMLYLIAGGAGLVWMAPELAIGNFTSPHVAGVTHLFTLGWLTVTIFGALYQLLPVALGAPIRSPRLGHASFWAAGARRRALRGRRRRERVPLHHAGVALVAVGVAARRGQCRRVAAAGAFARRDLGGDARSRFRSSR